MNTAWIVEKLNPYLPFQNFSNFLHPGASPRAHANEPPGETFTVVDLILIQIISFINAFMLSFNHLHEWK